jgi:hypothetical protein
LIFSHVFIIESIFDLFFSTLFCIDQIISIQAFSFCDNQASLKFSQRVFQSIFKNNSLDSFIAISLFFVSIKLFISCVFFCKKSLKFSFFIDFKIFIHNSALSIFHTIFVSSIFSSSGIKVFIIDFVFSISFVSKLEYNKLFRYVIFSLSSFMFSPFVLSIFDTKSLTIFNLFQTGIFSYNSLANFSIELVFFGFFKISIFEIKVSFNAFFGIFFSVVSIAFQKKSSTHKLAASSFIFLLSAFHNRL